VDARFEVSSCGGRIVNTAKSEASDVASKGAASDDGSKGLRIGLWVVQVLLALLFGLSGTMKLAVPYADLLKQGAWVERVPEGLVKFIGVAELSGALGLILPAATRIKPFLTPLAAAGFVVIMVLASALHLSLGQPPIAQVIIGGLAALVVWGRSRKAPITPRA
jgi:putative oxidoreductase